MMPSWSLLFVYLVSALSFGVSANADETSACPPCLVFDQLDKQIRDNELPRIEAKQKFAAQIEKLDTFLAETGFSPSSRANWVFPLLGYDLATSGADSAVGYVSAGYDYFAGNRHGGHPSFDLFIYDHDQNSLDDRTGKPVMVLSMTGGIIVAAETSWAQGSPLRGGKYLWVYDPTNHLLIYYAHNRDLLVKVGDRIKPGTPIATVGRSGFNAARRRSPTHLHLTILSLKNGQPSPEWIRLPLLGRKTLP